MANKSTDDEELNGLPQSEDEQLMAELIRKATSGKHTDYGFLGTFGDYLEARDAKKDAVEVKRLFSRIVSSVYKLYTTQVMAGSQDLDLLLALKHFGGCLKYYEDEVALIDDRIDEYRAYVLHGHILDTLMSNPRKQEDLVDYRKSR